ncbi:MAG: hypothetical protein QG648_363 [Patescibacteria group bacterium]|nr:hypothetical protein [Patescibacteria group bacterium]
MKKPMESFADKELERLSQKLQTDSKIDYLLDINDPKFWDQVSYCLDWLPVKSQKKWLQKFKEITEQKYVVFKVEEKIWNACIRNKIPLPWLKQQIKSKKGGRDGRKNNKN